MILENGWYESETTQDSGFFKDLPATSKKEKITYFPKLYYRMDNGLLYIRTEITLGKYQDQAAVIPDQTIRHLPIVEVTESRQLCQ